MLAVTHLDRRGRVLIRFMVGDVVSMVRTPCPACGRTSERIVGPIVRGGDLVKVKGMLINPTALVSALGGVSGIEEFQVVVQREDAQDPYSMDEMLVRVACREDVRERVVSEVQSVAADVTRVRPRVEVVHAANIYDAGRQTKAARFVDRRKSGE